MVCPACSDELSGKGPKSGRAAFFRAVAWGGGAEALGTIVWFAIVKITGYELGLISISNGSRARFGVPISVS